MRYSFTYGGLGDSVESVTIVPVNCGTSGTISLRYSADIKYSAADGTQYALRNLGSQKILTRDSDNNGANVYQKPLFTSLGVNNPLDQSFSFYEAESSVFYIMGAADVDPVVRYLTVEPLMNSIRSGSNVGSHAYTSANVQSWKMVEIEYGVYRICLNSYPTLALKTYKNNDGSNNMTAPWDNGNIFVETFAANDDYQLWELIPAFTTTS